MDMPIGDIDWYIERLDDERKREHAALVRANRTSSRRAG